MAATEELGKEIKAKVEAEAAEAEAENPDAPETETGEPDAEEEQESEQAETGDEPEAKRGGKKEPDPKAQFDAAMRAFKGKLCKLFEVPDLLPAPYPGVIGFLMPGYAEPKTNDLFRMCSTCNGLGKVLTGAQTGDESKDWHDCPDTRCKGRGYWQKMGEAEPLAVTGPLAAAPPPQAEGEWGEAPKWMGDPSLTPGG